MLRLHIISRRLLKIYNFFLETLENEHCPIIFLCYVSSCIRESDVFT